MGLLSASVILSLFIIYHFFKIGDSFVLFLFEWYFKNEQCEDVSGRTW